MPKRSKLEAIRKIRTEKSFQEDVLKILLQKMGYKKVTVTHGPDEHGKDLVFYDVDEKTEEEIPQAVVAKLGGIKGGTKSDKENISIIHNQVKLAFEVPWDDPISKRRVSIHRVWVVNNGPISNAASSQILALFGDNKDIIGRNVKFKSENELLAMLDKYWPDYFLEQEPFLLEYMSNLQENCEALNELRSFGYSREIKSLVDVFIEPSLIKEKPAQLKIEGKKSRTSLIDSIYEDLSLTQAINKKENLWIVGQPGSGKSTTARNMVLTIIKDAKKNASFDRIPVFFRFKDMLLNDITCLPLDSMINNKFNEINTLGYNIDPNAWLAEGRVTLFIDGLDEVPSSHYRENCLREIHRFSEKHSGTKIICTSRDIGFNKIKSKISGFEVIEILPFNYSQMKKFVEKWFKNNKSVGSMMMEAVKSAVVAGHLPKTPMVLTLLAVLLEENAYQELPANLTDLYSMFTELFLGKWDVQRNVQHMIDYNIKRSVLMEIASYMHDSRTDNMEETKFIEKIDQYAAERRIGLSGVDILCEIEERSGLLLRLDNLISFKHFSFQEYFTAKKWEIQEHVEKDIPAKVLDQWWQNVVFFYVGGKKDAPAIIKDVIKRARAKNHQDTFIKMMNIGQLLQAAYLTNHQIKVEALKYVLSDYHSFFEKVWLEIADDPDRVLSKFMLMLVFKHIFGCNYASMTLKKAMEEIFDLYWYGENEPDKNKILACYLTAYTLALLEFSQKFEELATSPKITDPLLLPMLDFDMMFLKGEYDTKFDPKIVNKVKKRIIKNAATIRKYLK